MIEDFGCCKILDRLSIIFNTIHFCCNGKTLSSEAIFCDGELEYSAFEGGYFDPEGGTMYYLTDWQGNNAAVVNSKGDIVQKTAYYPYGEPTVEPSGQRFLFGGKEREHAAGRNTYDFSARCLTPYGNWNVVDPKSETFYPFSPYTYCGGDPINYIDPDGESAVVALAVAFIVGATIDFTVQTLTNYFKHNDIEKSVKEVDVTSTIASGALTAIGGPTLYTIRGLSAIGIITLDAAVDVKINGSVEYIGGEKNNEKELTKVGIDLIAGFLPEIMMKWSEPSLITKGSNYYIPINVEDLELPLNIFLKFDSSGAKLIFEKDEKEDKDKEQFNPPELDITK